MNIFSGLLSLLKAREWLSAPKLSFGPKPLILGACLILAAQALVLGKPAIEYNLSESYSDDTETTQPTNQIFELAPQSPLSIPPSDEPFFEERRDLIASVAYASRVLPNTVPLRDSVAMILRNVGQDYNEIPAQLLLAHGPSHATSPDRYQRMSFAQIIEANLKFTAPKAMASGDLNPAPSPSPGAPPTEVGEDLVIGFNNDDSSLAIVNDFDAFAFRSSLSTVIPNTNQHIVKFNCPMDGLDEDDNPTANCRQAEVFALAVGNFGGDELNDIGIIAQTSLPHVIADGTVFPPNPPENIEGTYLFVCINNGDLTADNSGFTCAYRGTLASGSIGSFEPKYCAGTNVPKCDAGFRSAFGQSFSYVESGDSPGFFLATYVEGNAVVHVLKFKGSNPTGINDFSNAISHTYTNDYPNPDPDAVVSVVSVVSAKIANIVGGSTSLPDLVVQIKPVFDRATVTSLPTYMPRLDIVPNLIGWGPNNEYGERSSRISMPLGSLTNIWQPTPVVIGEFGLLGAARAIDTLDVVTAGTVLPNINPRDPSGDYLGLGVSNQRNPVYTSERVSSELPGELRDAVPGEFARSSNYLDTGTVRMLPDVALITEPNNAGTRHIFFEANLWPVN